MLQTPLFISGHMSSSVLPVNVGHYARASVATSVYRNLTKEMSHVYTFLAAEVIF
jgi:hypothetical protein